GDMVAVLLTTGVRLYSRTGTFLRAVALNASAGGIAFEPSGERLWVSEIGAGNTFRLTGVAAGGGGSRFIAMPAGSGPAGIAIDPAARFAYVALNLTNRLARVDLASGDVITIPTGMAPIGVAMTPDGTRIFVTNQGGFRPGPGETAAPSAGSNILIDSRGIARSGSVAVIDAGRFAAVAELPAGLLPTGVQVSPDGLLAAVANANSDSV